MSRIARRAASRELQCAKAFGTKRIHRSRFESKADVEIVTLPSGATLQPEVTTRKSLPALLKKKMAQARRYSPTAIPVVIISETGGEAIACLPMKDFVALLGIGGIE